MAEIARTDLLAIVDYISDDNPDAAQRLKDEIEAKVATLAERPKLYRTGRIPGTREMVVRSNYPPLSCRTSPPQGGRLAVIASLANRQATGRSARVEIADLPT